MILPKSGGVCLKERTENDKDQNCDALEERYDIVKKC